MGGKSLSQATVENEKGDNFIKFEGITDTNGGGFCSARTKNFATPLDLSEFKGITFKARSFKNFNYKFNLRDEENWDSIAWQSQFEVQGGMNWQEIKVPFSSFQPVRRGTLERDENFRGLKVDNLLSFQILLSKFEFFDFGNPILNKKFEEGKFRLDFGEIKAYK